MGKVFARKIMETTDGKFTIANVPNLWLQKTLDAFAEFVRTGEITAEQYQQYTGQTYNAA